MFTYGGFVARENEIGANVGEGSEDEAAVSEAGMGKGEEVLVYNGVAEVKNVEVDDTGGISFGGGGASESPFDSLGGLEEILRLADEVDFDHGVVEVR